MSSIREILRNAEPPFILSSSSIEFRILEKIVNGAAEQQRVIVLDGSRMETWDGFFAQFVEHFEFPEYFGYNLNALADCLRDLNWLEAVGYVLVVSASDRVLSREDHGIEVLLDYAELAGKHWAEPVRIGEWWDRGAVPFHTILHFDLKVEFGERVAPLIL
jgi:RNAse (barnase) inhibitor barstar